MESLEKALFEDPFYLYVALILAELVLAAIWHERRTRGWKIALAVPPVLAVVVWSVSTLVVTDRERIVQSLHEIAKEVEAGDIRSAAEYLDDSYTGFHQNKDVLVRAIEQALRQYPVKQIRYSKLDVKVAGPSATVHMVTIIEMGGQMAGATSLIWELRWAKRPAGWRIVEIQPPREGIELQ